MSERECLCYQDIDQIVKKCQQTDNLVQCILKRDGFKEVYLNPQVLYTVYFCYKQQYPNVEAVIRPQMKSSRHVAYRQSVR